jgi:16S rRNA (cytidine1402-2'-O)-methyltransferase
MPGAANPAGASGTLYVVATPIGNLEDVSARALRILREVALIAAEDTRRTAHLLTRYEIRTPTTSLNRHNEGQKTEALLARLARGESIALVSDAGTPTVADPGAHLVRQAISGGFRVEAIPGPSAILAMVAIAGLPADTFTFLGYPPVGLNERNSWFRALAGESRTVVFFESPHRIRETLQRVQLDSGDCHIVVGRELTKIHEEILRGSVSDVISALGEPQGEYCIALNLAIQTKIDRPEIWSDDRIEREYDKVRHATSTSKRQAIQATARLVGLSTNYVYQALERRRKYVK